MTLGIVAPLPSEARCLTSHRHRTGERIDLGQGACVLVSGVGPERARRAALELVDSGAQALVSFGCAGGLDPSIRVGEVLLPERVIDGGRVEVTTDATWRRALASASGAREGGAMLESARVLKTPEQKAEAFRASGALAVDMESASVGRVADEAGLPFLALRSVCDNATMRVPRASLLAVDEHGRLRFGALARALVERPGELVAIARLDLGFRAAQRALRSVSRRTGPRLGWER